MDMWENVLRALKVYMGGMVLAKEMQKEEDCWSFVTKESCAWQILGLKSQTKGKSLIEPVDLEQELLLCLWGKIQKVHKGCKSDAMGTSAQAGGCGSR